MAAFDPRSKFSCVASSTYVAVRRQGENGVEWAVKFDTFSVTASAAASLFALNVLLLGFLAELQLKASGFFRRRVSIIAREAAQ